MSNDLFYLSQIGQDQDQGGKPHQGHDMMFWIIYVKSYVLSRCIKFQKKYIINIMSVCLLL